MSLACASPSFPIEPVACGRGLIGLSACPGAAPGTLAHDLEFVAAFRPDAILTLVSPQELRLASCADLPERLRAIAPEWHHLVLPPGGAPDARFERLWAYVGGRLRAVLRRGGRVLIHCDDEGLRARWAAARLLAEMGEPMSEAAARVRAPRLAAARAFAPKPVEAASDEWAARVMGCLLGGALGDAFGYPLEFRTRAQICAAYGAEGLMEPRLANGLLPVSDDTQMTLYTADGLLGAVAAGAPGRPDQPVARIRRAYLAWLRTQCDEFAPGASDLRRYRELWTVRAPGSTCLTALRAGGRGTPGAPVNDSRGSGAVMRVAPLGLIHAIDADAAFHLAHAAAALTHGHPTARLSAAAFASLIRDLVGDTPLNTALDRMEARLQGLAEAADVLAAVRAARTLASSDRPATEAIPALGEGWMGEEALSIGLYAALRADSFEEALRLAANHDGDSDTTAALAGQVWGALYGAGVAPNAWVWRLDVLEPICDVAGRLIAAGAPAATETAPARRAPSASALRYRPAAFV